MIPVRATGVFKRFGAVTAVDGIDVSVVAGEVRGLLGPNGAGKSTLLRILLGLVRADAGAVELMGAPSVQGADGVAGWVDQPRFYPYLSGRENLELLGRLDRGPRADPAPLLERVGLGARAGDRVGTYSTGMRQRLGLAAALLRQPRVLFLDEPAAGLDPAGLRDLGLLLRELADEGAAVLISSHHIAEIDGLCDSFTILRSGRVVFDGRAEALAARAPDPVHRLGTSDDRRAAELAAAFAGASVRTAEHGLELTATDAVRDEVVLSLGRAGVAVQRLELAERPLAAVFFALTEGAGA